MKGNNSSTSIIAINAMNYLIIETCIMIKLDQIMYDNNPCNHNHVSFEQYQSHVQDMIERVIQLQLNIKKNCCR